MVLPRKIAKATKIGIPKRIRSPGHLAWVRAHACCIPGCELRPIEAAHVRVGTGGGMGIKPGDDWTISLCAEHHREQHQRSEQYLERLYGIDMKALAREFAAKSPHRGKWRRERS